MPTADFPSVQVCNLIPPFTRKINLPKHYPEKQTHGAIYKIEPTGKLAELYQRVEELEVR
jgi:hypothetical protein